MKISFVSPLLSRHLNPMGARTQTAISRKGGATIGIPDVEITRDSSKWRWSVLPEKLAETGVEAAGARRHKRIPRTCTDEPGHPVGTANSTGQFLAGMAGTPSVAASQPISTR
jgi:hypothetical protein